jgi:hypothetical protein
MGTGQWAGATASGGDLVAFFGDGMAQGLAFGGTLHHHFLLGPVDLYLCCRIDFVHRIGDGALAMAAGHAFNVKFMFHGGSPEKKEADPDGCGAWDGSMMNLHMMAKSSTVVQPPAMAGMVSRETTDEGRRCCTAQKVGRSCLSD